MRRMTEFALIETIIRSAAAGISVLLAVILLADRPVTTARVSGGLFCISTSFYVMLSGEPTKAIFGSLLFPISFIAVYGTVFFWWFAAALFDDNFRWRWWRIAPLAILPVLHFGHQYASSNVAEIILWYSHIGLNIVFFGDAFRLAVSNAADDLVDPRRRFRVVIAGTVAAYGLAIAAAEIVERDVILPDALRMAHGVGILILNLVFCGWLLRPRRGLFGSLAPVSSGPVSAGEALQTIDPVHRPGYDKLSDLMDAGVYREEGLTVAGLAEKVGVPEHQLRRLINRELGFRNFSAFLNARRIEDAKSLLSDPAMAKKQVLQIALDLGYASIAPFNRAFKAATDQTPTEYRKEKLNKG